MASKILPQFSQGFCSHQWDNFYSNILVYLKGVVYILYTPACSGTCSCLEGYLILLQCLYGFFFLLEGVLNPAYMGFSSCLAGYLLLIWVILTFAWRGTYSSLEGYLLLLGGVLAPAWRGTWSCFEWYLLLLGGVLDGLHWWITLPAHNGSAGSALAGVSPGLFKRHIKRLPQ